MLKKLLLAVIVFGLASASYAKASPVNSDDDSGPGNSLQFTQDDDGHNDDGGPNDDDKGPSLPNNDDDGNDCGDPGTPNPTSSATPEPSSLMLLGTSVLGVAGVVRRRFER